MAVQKQDDQHEHTFSSYVRIRDVVLKKVKIYNQEFSMHHANHEKLKTIHDKERKLPNQEKIRTLGEKETYKYLGILKVDTINLVEMKEKIKKPETQENEKTTRNQTILQEAHKQNKHLGYPRRKILRNILEVDDGRTSTNRPENKKTNDDAKNLHPKYDIDRLYVLRKGGRGLPALKIALMQQYNDSNTTWKSAEKTYYSHEKNTDQLNKNN